MFDPSFYETSFIVNELFERVMTKLKHRHYTRFAFLIVIKAVFFTNFMGKKQKNNNQHFRTTLCQRSIHIIYVK